MTIDSHHHFWNYSPEKYGWISEKMKVIRRDFGPDDLNTIAKEVGLDGVISVQAQTKVEENEALIAHGKRHDLIKGIVGWVDLTDPKVDALLERYSTEPLMRGFRHVLQGEPDERYMLRPDFNRGIAKLHNYGFTYDILIKYNHLKHTPSFVDQHEGQVFVIDHIAKPKIETAIPQEEWVRGIREIAKRSNVYCKVSGMTTETVPWDNWSSDLLRPYFDVVLEAFGPNRLMYGSDWPVCLVASPYPDWIATVRGWINELSTDEQKSIMGGTAQKAYEV